MLNSSGCPGMPEPRRAEKGEKKAVAICSSFTSFFNWRLGVQDRKATCSNRKQDNLFLFFLERSFFYTYCRILNSSFLWWSAFSQSWTALKNNNKIKFGCFSPSTQTNRIPSDWEKVFLFPLYPVITSWGPLIHQWAISFRKGYEVLRPVGIWRRYPIFCFVLFWLTRGHFSRVRSRNKIPLVCCFSYLTQIGLCIIFFSHWMWQQFIIQKIFIKFSSSSGNWTRPSILDLNIR